MTYKMENKEYTINEKNKTIAEFMGCYGDTMYAGGIEVVRYGFRNTHITDRWHELSFDDTTGYHECYNWLMPVWVKFRDLKDVNRQEDHKKICLNIKETMMLNELITSYNLIFEAIKWYNSIPDQS